MTEALLTNYLPTVSTVNQTMVEDCPGSHGEECICKRGGGCARLAHAYSTDANTSLMHESFHADDPSSFIHSFVVRLAECSVLRSALVRRANKDYATSRGSSGSVYGSLVSQSQGHCVQCG